MVPPLPHARELEGWPVQKGLHRLQTSPVSWLGEKELWTGLAGWSLPLPWPIWSSATTAP